MKKFFYAFFILLFALILTSCSGAGYEAKTTENTVLGNTESNVRFTEFIDYQCPACKNFHERTLPIIKSKYIETNIASLETVDFPLRSIHPHAQRAAESTYCAHDQGKQQEYIDFIFKNQANISNTLYTKAAEELELDMEMFESCVKSRAYRSLVDANYTRATQSGIVSTPTIVVNNIIMPLNSDLDMIDSFVQAFREDNEQAIKSAIKNALEDTMASVIARNADISPEVKEKISVNEELVNRVILQYRANELVNLTPYVNLALQSFSQELLK